MDKIKMIRTAGDIADQLQSLGMSAKDIEEVAEYVKKHAKASAKMQSAVTLPSTLNLSRAESVLI